MEENKKFLNWLFIVPIIFLIINLIIAISFPSPHETSEEKPAAETSNH